MKRLTSSLLSALVGLSLLVSCGEIREEITIDKDGSGTYQVTADMIPMMRNMMYGFAKMSAEEGADSLEIMAQVEEQIWSQFPEEVDSVLVFDDKIDAEIRNDPAKMALVDQATVFMRGGKSKGYLRTGLEFLFDNGKQFNDFLQIMAEGQKKDQKAGMIGETQAEVKITPKSFYRKTTQVSDGDGSALSDQATALLSDMKFLTILQFPRKIKKVNVTGYTIVEQSDKKITLQLDLLQRRKTGDYSEIDIKLK